MNFFLKDDIIGSPHKTLIFGNLFDFINNRVNIDLSDKKILLHPLFKMVYF